MLAHSHHQFVMLQPIDASTLPLHWVPKDPESSKTHNKKKVDVNDSKSIVPPTNHDYNLKAQRKFKQWGRDMYESLGEEEEWEAVMATHRKKTIEVQKYKDDRVAKHPTPWECALGLGFITSTAHM